MYYLRPYQDLRDGNVQINMWSWTSLVVGVFACLPGGSLYCFSLYGPVFHSDHRFALSALQLNLLSAFGWVGAAVASFPGGILCDAWGPVIPLVVSSFMSFLGYFLVHLTLDGSIAYHYGGLLMSFFVIGIGVQLSTIAILSSNLKNFPSAFRGRVLGLMGLAIAVAPSIYGELFTWFFTAATSEFLLFMGIINGLLCLVGAAFISVPKEKQYKKNWRQMLRLALGAPREQADNVRGLMESAEEEEDDSVWRPRKMLKDVRFWLIFVMGFCGASLGMMFLSVLLGSVYTSHEGPPGGQATAVIVGGLASSIGRLCGGVLTDSTLHLFKRSYWAFPCYMLMGIGLLLMMFIMSYSIVAASAVLIGLGYGALAGGIFPTIIADVFGTKHYGKNFSLLHPAYPLGFLVWGQVAGAIYQQHVPPGSVCLGIHCHFEVFIFMLCLLGVAVGATLYLTMLLPSYAEQQLARTSGRHTYVAAADDSAENEEL